MKLKGDWYFDGYEGRMLPGADGKPRKELVYTGEYYGFPLLKSLTALKLKCAACALLYLCGYLINSFTLSRALTAFYVGAPEMCSIIPGVYMLLGVGCFLFVPPEMTVRQYYGSIRRINNSLRFMVALAAIALAGNIFVWINNRALFGEPGEARHFALLIVQFFALTYEAWLMKRNKAVVVREAEPASLREKELQEKQRRKEARRNGRGGK